MSDKISTVVLDGDQSVENPQIDTPKTHTRGRDDLLHSYKSVANQEQHYSPLHDYEIVGPCRKNGQSTTYVAYDTRLKRKTFIKEYHNKRSANREARFLLSFDFAYFPKLYDFIEYDDKCYIVIEYLDGETLKSVLSHGGLPAKQALKYAIQLLKALEYLQSLAPPVVHGDIKPYNIIITKSDVAHLVDFGVSHYATDVPKGFTHGYTPLDIFEPWENIFNKNCNFLSADLYSFGCILFEMLTGQKLYDVIKSKGTYGIKAYLDNVDGNLTDIICKMVEDDPKKRYQSAKEVKKIMQMLDLKYEYDIALSFAGEDRKYVESVAEILKRKGIRVFYDNYEVSKLWGKDLYVYLSDLYSKKAKYCIIFVSKYYKIKKWANHEMRSAFTRAFLSNEEYILPARFDDTEIPGIRSTVGFIDLRSTTPAELADIALNKLMGDHTCDGPRVTSL